MNRTRAPRSTTRERDRTNGGTSLAVGGVRTEAAAVADGLPPEPPRSAQALAAEISVRLGEASARTQGSDSESKIDGFHRGSFRSDVSGGNEHVQSCS